MSIRYGVKPGGLVTLNEESYPQYKGMTGLLVEMKWDVYKGETWAVMVNGVMHPYAIPQTEMVEHFASPSA